MHNVQELVFGAALGWFPCQLQFTSTWSYGLHFYSLHSVRSWMGGGIPEGTRVAQEKERVKRKGEGEEEKEEGRKRGRERERERERDGIPSCRWPKPSTSCSTSLSPLKSVSMSTATMGVTNCSDLVYCRAWARVLSTPLSTSAGSLK